MRWEKLRDKAESVGMNRSAVFRAMADYFIETPATELPDRLQELLLQERGDE